MNQRLLVGAVMAEAERRGRFDAVNERSGGRADVGDVEKMTSDWMEMQRRFVA